MSVAGYAHGDEISGEQIYTQNCSLCHGADGSGAMQGVPSLIEKRNWLQQPEVQLLIRLKRGIQTPGAAMAMPPKGGNVELSDAQLMSVIAYMRKTFK